MNWKPRAMGATWIELAQNRLQKFCEVMKVSMFMGVEQPANFGDKGAWMEWV